MNRNISLVIAVLVVLAVVGGGLWFVYRPQPVPIPPTPAPTAPIVRQQPGAPAAPQVAALDPKAIAPRREGDDMVMGLATAPVTLIEYASLTCPHCAAFNKITMPRLKADYINRGLVKYVYRDFPLDKFALSASMIARCAGPDRYFAFIDVMFAQQESWAQSNDPGAIVEGLRRIAKLGGMSDATFDTCLKDTDTQNAVLKQSLTGEKQFEVRGTPTLIINGRKYTGGLSFEEIDKSLRPLVGPS